MVTIIIPIFNAEEYIKEALDSILSQSFSDFEILAVDDCGTDDTLMIVESYAAKDSRIRIIRNDINRGIAYSRNRALVEARGEYIALLDDDDIMCPGRLQLQVDYLTQHPEIGGVGGNAIWIDEDGNEVRGTIDVITDPNQIKMFLLFRNIFNNGEMMIRRSIVEQYNLRFGENCYGMEDFYFWIHFSKVARLTNLRETVLIKRQFEKNETSKMRNEYAELRRNKYYELQLLSLELSGFELDNEMKKKLLLYLGEDHIFLEGYHKIEDVYSLFDRLIEQAKICAPEVVVHMQDWFLDNMETLYQSTWKWNANRWDNPKRAIYYDELVSAQKWYVKQDTEKEKVIHELRGAIDWHVEQEKEMEKVIEGKEEALQWHDEHKKEMEKVLEEKEEALQWHAEHEKEMEKVIEGQKEALQWHAEHGKEMEKVIEEQKKALEWHAEHVKEAEK